MSEAASVVHGNRSDNHCKSVRVTGQIQSYTAVHTTTRAALASYRFTHISLPRHSTHIHTCTHTHEPLIVSVSLTVCCVSISCYLRTCQTKVYTFRPTDDAPLPPNICWSYGKIPVNANLVWRLLKAPQHRASARVSSLRSSLGVSVPYQGTLLLVLLGEKDVDSNDFPETGRRQTARKRKLSSRSWW